MPQPPFLPAPLSALALLSMAGLGAGLGGMPPFAAPDWQGWGGLVAGASAAALLGAYNRGMRRRFAALRLQVNPLPQEAQTLEGVVHFASTAPLAWCARRGEWCLDLARTESPDLPWRLDLRRTDLREAPLPLAQAATLDAVLTLSRRLFSAHDAIELVECDLEFTLPAPQGRITALAEGGYALHDAAGSRALCAAAADALLGEGGRLSTSEA